MISLFKRTPLTEIEVLNLELIRLHNKLDSVMLSNKLAVKNSDAHKQFVILTKQIESIQKILIILAQPPILDGW